MVYCVVQQMGNYKLCMTELQLRVGHQRASTRQTHEINNRRRSTETLAKTPRDHKLQVP